MIRVLYIIDCLYADAGGGSERQILDFYDRCLDFGIDLHICFLRDQPVHHTIEWRHPPLTLDIHRLASFNALKGMREVRRYIKQKNIDIVQTVFDDAAIFGAMLKRLSRMAVPLVLGLRNAGHSHSGSMKRKISASYKAADHFIVNARYVADYVASTYAIDQRSISVILNAITPQHLSSSDAIDAFMQRLRDKHRLIAITVANLRAVKGIDDLLEAIAQLEHRGDIAFVFLGEGELRQEYELRCQTLGIQDCVYFEGRRDNVIDYLIAADFGILASHSEGLSNTLIEYLNAELPMIATQVGGNTEILGEGAYGVLVPAKAPAQLAEAITKVAANIAFFRDQAIRAKAETMTNYSPTTVYKQMHDVYQLLLSEGRS